MNRRDEKKRALRHYAGVMRELRRDMFIRAVLPWVVILGLIAGGIAIANLFLPASLR